MGLKVIVQGITNTLIALMVDYIIPFVCTQIVLKITKPQQITLN